MNSSNKPVVHAQNVDCRVAFRHGSGWHLQQRTSTPASREYDPWQDTGKAKSSRAEVVLAMYRRWPLKQQPQQGVQ